MICCEICVLQRSVFCCRKRARSQAEQKELHLEKYPVRPPCSDSCRRKCSEKLSDDVRENVNRKFYSMNFGERRVWLEGYVQLLDVKRPRSEAIQRRKQSLWYSLPQADGSRVTVCKQMFLSTLGLKTDGMITEFLRAKHDNQTPITKDRRGQCSPANKVQHDTIRDHINSYHPAASHYNLAHTPNRRFLEPHLTITGSMCLIIYATFTSLS